MRAALAVLGRLIDRALRWCAPLTSMRLDQLTDDTPREGES
jgi:hypothetical protein